jgi:hypothetical protein
MSDDEYREFLEEVEDEGGDVDVDGGFDSGSTSKRMTPSTFRYSRFRRKKSDNILVFSSNPLWD